MPVTPSGPPVVTIGNAGRISLALDNGITGWNSAVFAMFLLSELLSVQPNIPHGVIMADGSVAALAIEAALGLAADLAEWVYV